MIYIITTPDGIEHHAESVAELRGVIARLQAVHGDAELLIRAEAKQASAQRAA